MRRRFSATTGFGSATDPPLSKRKMPVETPTLWVFAHHAALIGASAGV